MTKKQRISSCWSLQAFSFFSLFLCGFPSCLSLFEGKAEMTKIAVQSSVCYSKWKLLNNIGRGLLLVVEEWARALTQKYISRKIIVGGEMLRSCSTGRGQATDFLRSTGFLLFKVLYVGGHLYVDLRGGNRWNTPILKSLLKYERILKLHLFPKGKLWVSLL